MKYLWSYIFPLKDKYVYEQIYEFKEKLKNQKYKNKKSYKSKHTFCFQKLKKLVFTDT